MRARATKRITRWSAPGVGGDAGEFRQAIEHALEPEVKKIGLKLINVNIKDLNDESGSIEAIGREAVRGHPPAT